MRAWATRSLPRPRRAGGPGVAVIRISGPRALSGGRRRWRGGAGARGGGAAVAARSGDRRAARPGAGDRLSRAGELHRRGRRRAAGARQPGGRAGRCWRRSGAMAGLRPAEPGEFTRRALMNGRLDLAQVEGLGDLLAAETAAQQRQALALMDGRAVAAGGGLADAALVRALAFVEATHRLCRRGAAGRRCCDGAGAARRGRAAMRAGARAAAAWPSGCATASRWRWSAGRTSGKSTLLNALAGREAALTSEIAGHDAGRDRGADGPRRAGADACSTWRGCATAAEQVEALGVARARERAARADLRLFLVERAGGGRQPRGRRAEAGDLAVLAKADLRAASDGAGGVGADRAGHRRAAGSGSARRCASGRRRRARSAHARQRDAIERALRRRWRRRRASSGAERRAPSWSAEDLRGGAARA